MSNGEREPIDSSLRMDISEDIEVDIDQRPMTETAKVAVLEHLEGDAYNGIDRMNERMLDGLTHPSRAPYRAWRVVSGLTSAGKSNILSGLVYSTDHAYKQRLQESGELEGHEDIQSPIFTLQLKTAISLAKKKWGFESPIQGQYTASDYEKVGVTLERIREAALKWLPNKAAVFEEAILETETEDKDGNHVGTPRANIVSLRTLRTKADMGLIFVSADESERKQRLAFRTAMREAQDLDTILQTAAGAGLIEERTNLPEIKDTYLRAGNEETSQQQVNDILRIGYHLYQQNQFSNLPPFRDEDDFRKHHENAHAFTLLVKDHIQPRLADIILEDTSNLSENPNVTFVENHDPRPDEDNPDAPQNISEFKRNELRDFVDKRDVIKVLINIAEYETDEYRSEAIRKDLELIGITFDKAA